LSKALVELVAAFAPLIPALIEVLKVVLPLLPGFAKLVAGLLQLMAVVFKVQGAIVGFASKAISAVAGFVAKMQSAVGNVLGKLGELASGAAKWMQTLIGNIQGVPDKIAGFFSSLPSKVGAFFSQMKDTAIEMGQGILNWFSDLPGNIVSFFSGVGSRIVSTIKSNLPSAVSNLLPFASGGLVFGPTRALIGEAGPEAVIPLTRPLSMVDPSVRDLAAMVRGGGMAYPTFDSRTGKTINNTINVYPTQSDPAAVAQSVLNRTVVLARG
jgi:hypothetical protein